MCRLVIGCLEMDPDFDMFGGGSVRINGKIALGQFLISHYGGGELSLLWSLENEIALTEAHQYSRYAVRYCSDGLRMEASVSPPIAGYPSAICDWVAFCKANHTHPEHNDKTLPPSFRLIDVKDMKLVLVSTLSDKSKPLSYWALSYLWGGVEQFSLTKNYCETLHQPGSLESAIPIGALPKTIMDAIKLCQDAGQQYLWVDSLCILQDSPEKHAQITAMNIIYNRAELVLISSHGKNSRSGLLPKRRDVNNETRIEKVRGLQFAACRSLWVQVNEVSQSPWQRRGWTLQEYALSRRAAIFTETDIIFTCDDAVYDTNFKFTVPFRLGQADDLRRPKNDNDSDGVYETVLYKIIRQYFVRQLSMETDILNALEGIFSRCLGGPDRHFWGLPISHFAAWFTWTCRVGCTKFREGTVFLDSSAAGGKHCPYARRKQIEEYEKSHQDRTRNQPRLNDALCVCKFGRISEKGVFPSWSWAAWKHAGIACCYIDKANIPPARVPMYRVEGAGRLIQLNMGDLLALDRDALRRGTKLVRALSRSLRPEIMVSLCVIWTMHCKVLFEWDPQRGEAKQDRLPSPGTSISKDFPGDEVVHGYIDLILISTRKRRWDGKEMVVAMRLKKAEKFEVYCRFSTGSFIEIPRHTWDRLKAQPKWIALG